MYRKRHLSVRIPKQKIPNNYELIRQQLLPGQALSLQVCVSAELPKQSLPPCEGTGSLHRRILVFTPSPQDLEQVLHVELH